MACRSDTIQEEQYGRRQWQETPDQGQSEKAATNSHGHIKLAGSTDVSGMLLQQGRLKSETARMCRRHKTNEGANSTAGKLETIRECT
jgi:hypothetical protein